MIENLKSNITPTWCPGCYDYLVFMGVEQAVKQLEIPLENLVIVYDIGCIGNMADFFKTYAIHALHGRAIPTALGVKLANPKLTVLAVGGDGGTYGEGMNHLLSAARADIDITAIVANNHIYSLTTGQASPTSPKGSKTKSTPLGSISIPVEPVSLLKQVNPEVDVVSVDGHNPPEIISALKEGITHQGFSLVDIRQVCVTFGKQLTS